MGHGSAEQRCALHRVRDTRVATGYDDASFGRP